MRNYGINSASGHLTTGNASTVSIVMFKLTIQTTELE